REGGYRQVTLGTARNLYGLSAEPGLFQFKASLGFTAVPSQDFHEPYGIDFADLVLSLDSLADPSFALGYADDESRQLHGIVYSKSADVDLTPFDASFLTGVSLHTIPPRHRPA